MSLVIENLRKSYDQGEQRIEVLKGLNARIEAGKIVSVIGRSGSGKSTLLSILAGLEVADAGKVELGGVDLTTLSESKLTEFRARNISLVFQQYHLVAHLTALENVMLPLEILGEASAEERARELLGELGLQHRLDHVPARLSGGECQRVAIARALIARPRLLLADEPSGNLDIETGDKVMDLFFDVIRKHGITTLLVTHSESLARRCEKVLVLRGGHLEEN